MNYEESIFYILEEHRIGEWSDGFITIKGNGYKAVVYVHDGEMECLGGDGLSPITIETPTTGPRIFKSDGNGTGEFVVDPGTLGCVVVKTQQRVP